MKQQAEKAFSSGRQLASLPVAQKASACCFILFLLFLSACSQLEKPKPEPFYAETKPPPKQEFRWSNGKTPKSFDPALAAASPETDVVRAIFDGLTDTDSKNLEAIPAIAEKWSASEDFKTWTFHLRKDAKWSNGKSVTAQDFVNSWKRLSELGEKVSHNEFLINIVGMKRAEKETISNESEEIDLPSKQSGDQNVEFFKNQIETNPADAALKNAPRTPEMTGKPEGKTEDKPKDKPQAPPKIVKQKEVKLGVEAVDDYTLKVSLIKPDKEFPALVAHPIFRPIYGDGKDFEASGLNANIVTSGAFRIFSVGQDGITLDRSENYWNREAVKLERVRFVPTENAEKALEAYRAGEVDAVTNADFEPLALKLLTPYDDFRRTTHSALNFYEFNRKSPLFRDRRVREALAIAIERERLTEDEMQGASRPAFGFLPFEEKMVIAQNVEKAQTLLTEAGFPGGENFPAVRLVVNRNNMQQRIARRVAKMWKENLGIATEIIVKSAAEIEEAKNTGDFDIIRRGAVLPTSDETANMMAIFAPKKKVVETTKKDASQKTDEKKSENQNADEQNAFEIETFDTLTLETENTEIVEQLDETSDMILTEEQAIIELPAIPLYFPTSYSLVKPYVQGFEMNTLDAPSLKDVQINNSWQPRKADDES